MSVLTGLDRLLADRFAALRGHRVGLLAHQPSVDARLRPIVPLMVEAGVHLATIFGPEHGFDGAAQDMEVVGQGMTPRERRSGARLFSLYGTTEASLRPTREMLEDLDVLVVDLQDVGARYYTYAATMGYLLQGAAEVGLRVMILDRPNPLGGLAADVEGPFIQPGYFSFVGAFSLPVRHGLTLGEYAGWIRRSEGLDLELEVVKMEGWSRGMDFEATGLPWVMPSPNMPTVDTAWIYPGQCLLEGTNLSEGRGTTRPFELCGAPFLDGAAWGALAEKDVGPGFVLRPTTIKPMFQKHAGQACGAVQVHVTDRWAARSLRLSVALLRAAQVLAPGSAEPAVSVEAAEAPEVLGPSGGLPLSADGFAWRTQAYEFVGDRLAIDLLFGSKGPRRMLRDKASVLDILETFQEDEETFRASRSEILLYPEQKT